MSSELIERETTQGEKLVFRVEGMDCASCVGKIETALHRLNGLSDVNVNFAAETLSVLRSSSSRTTASGIAKKIKALGFDVQELTAEPLPVMPTAIKREATNTHDHSVHAHGDESHTAHSHSGCGGHEHDHEHSHEHSAHAHGDKDHSSHSHSGCGGHGHNHEHNHEHSAHVHGDKDHSAHSHSGCGGQEHGHGPCCDSHQTTANTSRPAPTLPPNLSMHVEGMDCASCVSKIETALGRMTGVSDARINFATETLELTLAASAATQIGDIEKTIKSLGFGVSDVHRHDGSSSAAPASRAATRDLRWWQTKKGRLVLGLGALMGAAYGVSQFVPGYSEWIFAAAVVVGVIPFARKAFALATSGSPFSIETLMVVASIGALIIGETEEAAAVVFLFAVGELLESVAAGRARAGIKALASLVPKTGVLLGPDGTQSTVPVTSLRVGDRVLVRPGDQVPADGVIFEGESSLDESPITGESVPRQKAVGEKVFAGSINVDGVLKVQVEKAASDNTISRIIQLVEQAQSAKAPTARFIEKFSSYYTPSVMLIAALIMLVPPLFMGGDWDTWVYRALALLLIACPCALVLSTPAAIASGLAVATRRGLLIKGGNALEIIGQIRAIAFDKTGTLTEGKPRVTEIVTFADGNENEVLALAAAVEAGSSHPLAKAVIERAQADSIAIPVATNASATAGKAVHATVAGRRLAVGSPSYADQVASLTPPSRQRIEALEDSGKTVAVLFDEQNGEVLGLLALRDEPRDDAREGVAQLKTMGIRSVMLTGDNRRTAKAIAGNLGLDWEAELLPQDKLSLINGMKKNAKVAMVGDGINDAPALATADVGIAMGGGTDVALETADAALLQSRVTDVAYLVSLSRATMKNIHQNVAFAVGLKGLFLVTSVLGITGLWVAVLADTGATALVTLNALRLLRFKGR